MYRVRLLSAGKLAALALFLAVTAVLVGYLLRRDRPNDGPSPGPKLQGRIVAEFHNTRYAHEVEGQVRFILTAGVDKAYEDGSHELEQVRLESRGKDGNRNDVVTADRAKVSNPADLNKLDAEMIANVVVQTSDGLNVKTNYLRYDGVKNLAETKELIEFEGNNLSGRSIGAIIEATDERVRLLKDVEITINPGKKAEAGAKKRPNETPEEKAARKARKRALRQARRARGEKPAGGVKKSDVATLAAKKPVRIRCADAVLEKKEQRVTFGGGVVVKQDGDEMRADRMTGFFTASNSIERIEARGNANLKQADRAEITSADMDFFFAEGNRLARAVASGGAYARSLGQEPLREARAATMEATFTEGGQGNTLETITGQGRTEIHIHAPAPANEKDNPAKRDLVAESITMQFHPDGRNLKSAEAVGDAVMTVTPVRAERGADKKTIRAPRMEAVFYEEGNRVQTFKAAEGVKVEIESLVPDAHPPRVTTSRELTADFLADSQDVERITQEGDFKYHEGDRNATAERATYDGQAEVLYLRGKRPMAWDAKARTQADEIDYDRKRDETHARGDVRTTYYSRETTGDSTPFKNTKSPVFLTAERADARNKDGVAVYTGKARGWQDDNFVKGDRIELYDKDKRMVATGNVESALYTVKREAEAGKREVVPGFATADRMTYSDTDRLVHYDGKVKARQGTDRIEAAKVDVYLQKETNDVDRLFAEGDVVLIQPGRRGEGDHLIYTAEDGRAVLTGNNARVEDNEKGTTTGAQLTLYTRDDKIVVDNQQGTGRVRSTHRLANKN